MDLSILIILISPFLVLEVSGRCFHFYCIFYRHICKQTVLILVRRRVVRRLNWVCIVCIIPKRVSGLKRDKHFVPFFFIEHLFNVQYLSKIALYLIRIDMKNKDSKTHFIFVILF